MLFFIAATAIVSGLLQLVFHLTMVMYFPRLGRITRYVLGTLGLLLPLSTFLWLRADWVALAAVWACSVVSGAAVKGAYLFGDQITEYRNKMNELERLRITSNAKAEEED